MKTSEKLDELIDILQEPEKLGWPETKLRLKALKQDIVPVPEHPSGEKKDPHMQDELDG